AQAHDSDRASETIDASLDQALEWTRFLERAQGEARTERGKLLVSRLASPSSWAPDVATAHHQQVETQEATQLLDREAIWGPLLELADPEAALDRLEKGSVLEIGELVLLRRWLYAIDSWAQTPREEIRGELFRKALSRLPDPFQPLQKLERVLTPEG